MGPEGKITLRSSDGQTFQVDEKVAFMSDTVKKIVQEVQESTAVQEIPLQQVRSEILAKVLEYCSHHADDAETSEEDEDEDEWKPTPDESAGGKDKEVKEVKELTEAEKWDKEYVNVEDSTVFELILAWLQDQEPSADSVLWGVIEDDGEAKAANYMNIKQLLDFLVQHVADMIIACGDNPEAIRKKFGITNDMSEEEVNEIKRANTWFFS